MAFLMTLGRIAYHYSPRSRENALMSYRYTFSLASNFVANFAEIVAAHVISELSAWPKSQLIIMLIS